MPPTTVRTIWISLILSYGHGEKIVRQNDEVRQLARRDRSFDRFLMRVVGAVERIHAQRFFHGDPLVGSPGLSVPASARHHSLNGHARVERSRAEVGAGRRNNSGIEERAISHAVLHHLFAVEFEFVGIVVGVGREGRRNHARRLDAPHQIVVDLACNE